MRGVWISGKNRIAFRKLKKSFLNLQEKKRDVFPCATLLLYKILLEKEKEEAPLKWEEAKNLGPQVKVKSF